MYMQVKFSVTLGGEVGAVHVQASYCQNRIAASLGGNDQLGM